MPLSLGVGLGTTYGGGIAFSPAALFAAGEQGLWFDPSDMTTLFQDSAGTTPVTAVEQPVGKILDKSGRSNHATQATAGSRPVLSARYNLLTKTEQFDDAAWTKSSVTVTANTTDTTDPIGGNTADKLLEVAIGTDHDVYQLLSGQTAQTFSVYVKANGRTAISLRFFNATSQYLTVTFDLSSVAVSQTANVGSIYSSVSSSITSAGNGWYRCSVTATRASGSTYYAVDLCTSPTPTLQSTGAETYGGDITKGIYIWGADVRVSNDGTGLPSYQRVTTSTDYDTAGFPMYLKFDGTDDSLATGSIDFSGTDKMTVWAGVRKLSDAAQGVVAELTASIASNNGAFLLSAPNSAGANYNFSSKGTTQVDNTVASYTAPLSNVVTGQGNISGPSNIIRINGTQAGSVATSQGTGNYANAALYIGQRSGGTLSFNGRLYSLIARGASSSVGQIASGESWVNSKTRAY